jgi:hypothetical protein
MKINTVSIDMEAFGAQFANMDDNEQSLFFKGLAREVKLWPSLHQAHMQFCAVGRLVPTEDRKVLGELLAFIGPDE